jgi:hypothetical protein
MSTKIHNGYRLADGTNPFEFARRVRSVMDPLRDEADAEMFANMAAKAVDFGWLRQEQIKPMLAYTLYSSWEEGQRKLPDDSRAKDPHRFEMCIGEDPGTGRLLVRLYTELPSMKAAFEGMDSVESYDYWDNWHAPDSVTEEEWDERRAAWDRVMPDYAPPAEHMLSFVLRTEANPGTIMLCAAEEPLLSRVPGRAARALNVATHSYLAQFMLENVPLAYALKSTRGVRDSGLLQPLADLIEPELWDIGQDLLLNGSGDLLPASPELAATVKDRVAALHRTRREQHKEQS